MCGCVAQDEMNAEMDHGRIVAWLRETDAGRLESLRTAADAVRRTHCGDEIFLRGLLEISNTCMRNCLYCGLRVANRSLRRYRMTDDEIFDGARKAARFGYGTVVLQAGEDPVFDMERVAVLVERIRCGIPTSTGDPLAVTLSLGERTERELARWREAGADRYLLRFETSNRTLYEAIHPPLRVGEPFDRFEMLRVLRRFGYEVGSGVMVGIPGQSYDDLARDIELFRELELDMIGVGPFLASPGTPLGDTTQYGGAVSWDGIPSPDPVDQVPATAEMTCRVLSLTRLVRPDANIPATTALATMDATTGRTNGFVAGANIVMPNLTPTEYRELYAIYPGKASVHETAEAVNAAIAAQVAAAGRTIGRGPGTSPHYRRCRN